jgi:hypothetical protein
MTFFKKIGAILIDYVVLKYKLLHLFEICEENLQIPFPISKSLKYIKFLRLYFLFKIDKFDASISFKGSKTIVCFMEGSK